MMDPQRLATLPSWEWPPEAGPMLLGYLLDEQARYDDRLLAVELAGDIVVMDDEIAAALLEIVTGTGPEELRGRAAIALGPTLEQCDTMDPEAFGEIDVVPVDPKTFRRIRRTLRELVQSGDTPKQVRRMAIEASVRAPRRWHADAIREAWESEDREWRITALFCMGWVRGFRELILFELEDPDVDLRIQAILAAGRWELKGAWEHVRPLLSEDAPKPLVLAAIEASTGVAPRSARKPLRRLARSEDPEIATLAREALAELEGDPGEDF